MATAARPYERAGAAAASALAMAAAACALPGRETSRPPFEVAPTSAPLGTAACEAYLQPPPLAARFEPKASGKLSLIAARGDARLWAPHGEMWVTASDGSVVALAESATSTVAVWRSGDAVLVDLVHCPGGPIGIEALAMSPDQRWIVTSGWRTPWRHDEPVTCIVDRRSGAARVVPGDIDFPMFDLADGVVIGRNRGYRLETGAEVSCNQPVAPASDAFLRAHHIAPWNEAREVAVSHDGRYVVGWVRGHSVALWDTRSGKMLWTEHFQTGEYCQSWQFSADDRFIEAVPGRAAPELRIATATGEVTRLPYGAMTTRYLSRSPDHQPRSWWRFSLHSALKYSAPLPARTTVARSPDGAATASRDPDGRLAIERDGRCLDLGMDLFAGDPVVFSADGGLLYAAQVIGGAIQRGLVYGTVSGLWRSDTGALVRAVNVKRQYATHFLPAAGRVGFAGVDGDDMNTGSNVHLVDAASGRALGALHLPTRGLRAPNAAGTSWLLDLGDEIHLWNLGDPHGSRPIASKRRDQRVYPAVFSPDDRLIAAGTGDGALALWSRDGRRLPLHVRHEGGVKQLAFSPDGRWLASWGEDHEVRVVDVARGTELGSVALPTELVTLLWWSPHGDRLVIDTERRFQIEVAPSP